MHIRVIGQKTHATRGEVTTPPNIVGRRGATLRRVVIVSTRNDPYPTPRPTGRADTLGGSCKIYVNLQGPHYKLPYVIYASSLLRPRGSLHSVHRSLTPVPVVNNLQTQGLVVL
jgi:hypothetical protein